MQLIGPLVTKVCRICKETFPTDFFYKHKNTKDRLKHECKECFKILNNAYFLANKEVRIEKRKDYHFRSSYGITKQDVEKLKEKQNFKCMICEDIVNLVVDHDHKTGKVRALLCNPCNQGIGSLKDDPEILDKAANYLRIYK